MNASTTATAMPSADHINISTIFSNNESSVITKEFKGGRVMNIFGNVELDFTHADLTGVAELHISQAFGAVKLIIPNDWHVDIQLKNLLAVVEDHRPYYQKYSPNKTLVLRGYSAFAYIEYESIGERIF